MNEKIIAISKEVASLEKRKLRIIRKQEKLINDMKSLLVEQTDSNSVEIILKGKRLLLDLENLKDEEYAMRDKDGNYDFPCGHYFNADNAEKAAKKAGKRLFTPKEWGEIENLPNRWDDQRKGRWFTFQTPTGNAVEVFFEACGYISAIDGALSYIGTSGRYWSASPASSSNVNGTGLYINSSYVFVHYNLSRAGGRLVRCVREL